MTLVQMKSSSLHHTKPINNDEKSALFELSQTISRECIECDGPMCYSKNPPKKCSKCHTSYYCSKECQKKDWKEHKQKCTDINQIREAIKNLGKDVDQFQERKALNKKCPICLEEPMESESKVVLNNCGHAMCVRCIQNWYEENQNESLDEAQAGQTCTLCHHTSEVNIFKQMEERLFYYERLSDWFQNPLSIDERRKYGEIALVENAKLLSITISNSAAQAGFYVTRARILDLIGYYKGAMQVLEYHCKEENFSDLPDDQAGQQPSLFELLMLKACIHQNLEQYDKAVKIYFDKILPTLDERNQGDNWNIYRIYCRAARCAFKLGEYENCIKRCNIVLNFHRHVDEIYECKALSLRALGKLDEAIETMNVAIIYETPGDDKNTARLVKIYQELCDLRATKVIKVTP